MELDCSKLLIGGSHRDGWVTIGGGVGPTWLCVFTALVNFCRTQVKNIGHHRKIWDL